MDSTIMRGEIVAADFANRGDHTILVHVAVEDGYKIGHRRVVVIDAAYFDSALPSWREAFLPHPPTVGNSLPVEASPPAPPGGNSPMDDDGGRLGG